MISFENWLETNQSNLNNDVYGLFKDSLRCFKNDIIRPAYLLAYQGMLLALREKILIGKMPEGFVIIRETKCSCLLETKCRKMHVRVGGNPKTKCIKKL